MFVTFSISSFLILYLSTESSCIAQQFPWMTLLLAVLCIWNVHINFSAQNAKAELVQMIWLLIPLVASSDCNYTCHHRCQSLIQLDCSTDGKLSSTEQEDPLDDSIETDTNVVSRHLLCTQSTHGWIFALLVWGTFKTVILQKKPFVHTLQKYYWWEKNTVVNVN